MIYAFHRMPQTHRPHALLAFHAQEPAINNIVHREIGAKADMPADGRDRFFYGRKLPNPLVTSRVSLTLFSGYNGLLAVLRHRFLPSMVPRQQRAPQ